MFQKAFIPVYFLSFVQLLCFFIYKGFYFTPKDTTFLFVLASYFSFLIAIFISGNYFKRKIKYVKLTGFNPNKYCHLIFIILILFFIIKPTIKMFAISSFFGADYIREKFFTDKRLQIEVFGSMFISSLTVTYIIPFFWFLAVLYMDSDKKINNFMFFFIIIALAVMNMSFSGRFNLYFAMIMVYLREIYNGRPILVFLKKYIPLFVFLFIFSFTILFERQNRGTEIGHRDLLMLFEYHIIQPFFLSQKIDNYEIIFEGFPFKTIITSLLAPIFFIFGMKGTDLPISYYPIILNDFTLHSTYTSAYYNAYATFIPYFYVDFGYFSPIFIFFFFIFLFFLAKSISIESYKRKYIIFLAFILYASLFQSDILTPGAISILLLFPLFTKFFLKNGN